ncbi:hypothetical protein [Streptomyces sp. GS7]|uniref:hypothetical protein n=1 Tax=Streptomyces sp. GS7 TaxID=2692234 RepID=UPI0013164F18|nr:hypothetical protein [Streptomyces sp. GS7]QHC26322.1 hypothetical protein GR130_38110 [Streptomyces sp. GS7]
MVRTMQFAWAEIRHGWVTFVVSGESGRLRASVGDGIDAPRLLLNAMSALLNGAAAVTFSFDGEPTEIRWNMQMIRGELKVSISLHPQWGEEENVKTPWVEEGLPLLALAEVIHRETEFLINSLGEEGYREAWALHGTPTDALKELKSSIERVRANSG